MRLGLKGLAMTAALVGAVGASAQTPTIGVATDSDCASIDILAEGGELYALKIAGPTPIDWQVHATAKGGPTLGMTPGDMSGDTFQVVGGNFSAPEAPIDIVLALLTFPDGRYYLDNGDLTTGFNFMDSAGSWVFGDSLDGRVSLPGDESEYWVDLGTGPERFPRWHAGGIELAVADLHELGALSGGCQLGGVYGNTRPGARDGKFVEGYNVYRMIDTGVTPTQAELGRLENWVYWFSFDPRNEMQHTLARWHELDDLPSSGDELLLLHDSDTHYDGRERWPGTPPDMGSGDAYWYGFQPTILGRVGDFASVSIARAPAADLRDDLDGDGEHDSVDLNGPGSLDGPEFLSPQAELGLDGLGLTSGGRALLSRVVLASAPPPPVGRSLRLGSQSALWGLREGVSGYKVRRGTRPDFMQLNPTLRDHDVIAIVEEPLHRDPESPPRGGLFYYVISSVDERGRESFEPRSSGEW